MIFKLKKVTEDYEIFHFNTAISQLMIMINEAYKQNPLPKAQMEAFVKLLLPVAPHIAEELWSKLGHKETISYEPWPTYDASKLVDQEVEIVVQINGKVRAKQMMDKDLSKEQVEKAALEDEKIQTYLSGKEIRKVIVVPGKLVNIVAR